MSQMNFLKIKETAVPALRESLTSTIHDSNQDPTEVFLEERPKTVPTKNHPSLIVRQTRTGNYMAQQKKRP